MADGQTPQDVPDFLERLLVNAIEGYGHLAPR